MTLPQPSPQESAHSAAALAHLIEHIGRHGPMYFDEYMDFCLYDPTWGYYQTQTAFGHGGDFTTAPEISSIFAYAIGSEILTLVQAPYDILEIGPGRGTLAHHLLTYLKKQPPKRYFLWEKSSKRRQELTSLLSSFPEVDIIMVDDIPEDFHGVILANEVIDAMACRRYRYRDQWQTAMITYEHQLQEIWQPTTFDHPPVTGIIERQQQLPAWLENIARHRNWHLFLFDYGDFEPHVHLNGSLRCFYKHHVHNQYLIHQGIQDLTADVDFYYLTTLAENLGLTVTQQMPQYQFMLKHDLNALIHSSTEPSWRLHQQLKTLTLPQEMGERIKFLHLSPGS